MPIFTDDERQGLQEISIGGRVTVEVFITLLSSKITQYDMRLSKAEARRGSPNIYRLGIMLKEVQAIRKAMSKSLDKDDPKTLQRLKARIDKSFTGLSPADFTKKAVDKYIDKGTIPKISGKGGTALLGIRL